MNNSGKEKFSTKLFVTIALAAFIILASLFVYLNFQPSFFFESENQEGEVLKLFLKEEQVSDPMITVFPQTKDMLDGPIISSDDPSIGEGDVYLVIFSDFKCAYCQNQEKVLKKIVEDYQGKVRLIWKDFPEIDTSSDSWQASIAGRCADEQGKFWEYHDLLYESADSLSQEKYLELAEKLDLNLSVFKDCLKDDEIAMLVEDNILEAEALDIVGIPYIFVNDKAFFGEVTYDELKQLIEAEL